MRSRHNVRLVLLTLVIALVGSALLGGCTTIVFGSPDDDVPYGDESPAAAMEQEEEADEEADENR